jgi:SAM-dependent methyltransferase
LKNRYQEAWDHYVDRWSADLSRRQDPDAELAREGGRSVLRWPGDEWGDQGIWREFIDRLLVPAGLPEWKRVVELGQGSGKYSLAVLAESQARLECFDVSPNFIRVCRERCAKYVREKRLALHLLKPKKSKLIQKVIKKIKWTREVDAFISIDAMVHVDLNVLASYFLAASEVLREGGKLVMTLADVSTDAGFDKLMSELEYTYTTPDHKNCQFEWLHPALIEDLLPRFGFKIEMCSSGWRDLELIASLEDLDRADDARQRANPR